jgi:putative membrane protein
MSAAVLFGDDAKKRVAAAIHHVEKQTSAEVVVMVRRTSGRYGHANVTAGSVAGITMLVFVLFHPKVVPLAAIPIDVVLAFAAATITTAYVDPLRRLFVGARVMNEAVLTAARAAFVERGISKTRGRTGILVYVSTFERRLEIVHDVGCDASTATDAWARATRGLHEAIASSDLGAFVEALRALGPALAADLPALEDDVNELPDEPVTT